MATQSETAVYSKIDVPSLLIGAGAGLGGWEFLSSSLLAGVGILTVAGVAIGVGYLAQRREAAA